MHTRLSDNRENFDYEIISKKSHFFVGYGFLPHRVKRKPAPLAEMLTKCVDEACNPITR